MVKVVFHPGKVLATANIGQSLLDVATSHGISIRHACGGNCACTTCRVYILSGEQHLSQIEASESGRLGQLRSSPNPKLRLACQAELISDSGAVNIEIPDT